MRMGTRRKNESRSDWRLTMDHIGRELRKLYLPAGTPPGFHDLFAEEEERRRIKTLIAPIQHGQQDNDSKDDPNLE